MPKRLGVGVAGAGLLLVGLIGVAAMPDTGSSSYGESGYLKTTMSGVVVRAFPHDA